MATLQEKIELADKFVNETDMMRKFQIEYFKYRDVGTLRKAKAQEGKVDRMIKQWKGIEPLQGRLW